MNIIFGSGIVGLLAKRILGPDWTVVPFYRSRFYSFNPPLADNFIVQDERLDEFVYSLIKTKSIFTYRRAWSMGGHLYKEFDKQLLSDWLSKLFGVDAPPQSTACFGDKLDLRIYDARTNNIYEGLVNDHIIELKEEASKGQVSAIGDHYFIRNGVRVDFENAVSTIPLSMLAKLLGLQFQLKMKTIHYLNVETDALDLEKMNQALVVDPMFSFYKVTNMAQRKYLFFCHEEIQHPGMYLQAIIPGNFEILDGTSIADAIPSGAAPKLDFYEQKGIFCVGSSAQHDWCMDLSSCILRLLRYSARGHKPAQPVKFHG